MRHRGALHGGTRSEKQAEMRDNMTDIHAHIIPGIDDGSPDMMESLEMARIAVESGIRKMISTPHFNLPWDKDPYTKKEILGRLRELNEQLEKERIPLSVLPGMEVYGDDDLPRLLEEDRLIPLNGTKYLLMEFDFDEIEERMADLLSLVQEKGLIPIIAHPERYRAVQHRPQFIYECICGGCLVQVNKGSILGRFGRGPRRAAIALLDHGLVTCVASDAHFATMRTPDLREAYEEVRDHFGWEYAKMVFDDNPERIAQGKEPYMLRPLPFSGDRRRDLA